MSTATFAPPHVLHRRAVDLSRRIYGSLPWGFRVAELFRVLAADSLDAFGRVMYAEFIKSVIRGMPDLSPGKTAFDMVQDVERKGADALPPGYGREFASRVYKVLLSKFSDPEIAEDAMSNLMLQAARQKLHIHNGADLHSAESYIITACLNSARDLLRARGRRREDSLVRDRDDNPHEIDVTDPAAFRDLDKSISPSDMTRILHDAGRVSPRAREYLESVLRGDSQSEWARELGVTDAAVSKFVRKIRPKLREVLRQHLRSAAAVERHLRQARAPYSYDRRSPTSAT